MTHQTLKKAWLSLSQSLLYLYTTMNFRHANYNQHYKFYSSDSSVIEEEKRLDYKLTTSLAINLSKMTALFCLRFVSSHLHKRMDMDGWFLYV